MAGWNEWIPGTNMTLTEVLDALKSARVGLDVKDKLYWSFYKIVELAIKEGNANFDVAKAAGAFKDLASRLDAGDAEDMKLFQSLATKLTKGAGEIEWGDISQEVKEDLVDGQVAVVGEKSVGAINVADRALPASKLALSGYVPRSLIYTFSDGIKRGLSENFTAEAGTKVLSTNADVSISVNAISDGTHDPIHIGWAKEVVIPKAGTYVVRAKLDSTEELTKNHLELFSAHIQVIDGDVSVQRKDLKHVLPTQVFLENGAITGGGGDDTAAEASVRLRSDEWQLAKGDTITLKDNTLDMAIAIVGGTLYVNGWNSTHYTAPENQTVRVMLRKKGNSLISPIDAIDALRLTTADTVVTHEEMQSVVQNKRKYVSLAGSDNNSGDSLANGYQTLQKAIDSGATQIFVQAGVYRNQTVDAQISDLEISVVDTSEGNHLAIFSGADTITNWSAHGAIYRAPYTGNQRFRDVFVNKTLPIETTGTRPTYNAVLWEGDNLEDDYKMKPVLTIAECQAEVGTFYYDGTHVYINPQSISNAFNAVRLDRSFRLVGDTLKMTGIVSDFVTNAPMIFTGFSSIDFLSCGALHSSAGDGFRLDNSFGRLTRCIGAKNRNDGFNNHYTGEIVLENCAGINNYDDGASPHEDCTMTVIGGEYRGNGKGGLSPASGARAYVYNAKLIGNKYAIYNSLAGVGSISSGNLIKDNEFAYLNTADDFTVINDVRVSNGAVFSPGSVEVDLH